jgi:hypothetical protein
MRRSEQSRRHGNVLCYATNQPYERLGTLIATIWPNVQDAGGAQIGAGALSASIHRC